MFKKNHFIKMDEAGDNDGGSGGASDAAAAAAQAAADPTAALRAELETMKRQAATLLDEKKKLQKSYEGIDVDKVREMQKHFDNNEEAKLIAEGKLEDLKKRWFEQQNTETAKKLDEASLAVQQAKEQAVRFNSRLFQGEIRANAPTDMHPGGLDDAMRHAPEVFMLDEEGNIVPKDGRNGRDGKTPYTLKEWFEDTRQTHPNRYANSNSGSSYFEKGGKSAVNTMSRSKFDSLGAQEKVATIKAGITIVDRN